MGNIHPCLSRTKDNDFCALAKLISALELRRVKYCGNSLEALDVGDDWTDIDASANGNSITEPFIRYLVILTGSCHDMTLRLGMRSHIGDVRLTSNRWPKAEFGGVVL